MNKSDTPSKEIDLYVIMSIERFALYVGMSFCQPIVGAGQSSKLMTSRELLVI